ncbi:unnamed protein product [Nippostrongylus brasiliensis]|uniref:Bestrophin homolog n=1 Tax=Nippostrongylus brasiliensis TaxID=27835 RepID=A0A158QZB9_NIPBR|nr:unnamed protein product [Nippostrongylus brasiliensis]
MTVSYNLDISSVSVFVFMKLLFRWRGSIWKLIMNELLVWLCGYYVFGFYTVAVARNIREIRELPSFDSSLRSVDTGVTRVRMTVSYNSAVSSVSTFTFFRLLLRWRGSIWKSISGELLLWLVCYYIVFVVYRFALSAEQQQTFEAIAHYCDGRLVYIPLTFMLGFFVSIIVDRWRDTFKNMGWIENFLQILAFRDISMRVRRRFPTMETLVVAGFLNENELKHLEDISLSYNKYWVPLQWALSICVKALEKKYFEMPYAMICVQNEIKAFRTNMAQLCNYDWVPVPIAYPQVVFLAVRAYFVICLVSRQYLLKNQVNDHSDVSSLLIRYLFICHLFLYLMGTMIDLYIWRC